MLAFPSLEISVAFLHTAAGKGLDDVGQDMARANAVACMLGSAALADKRDRKSLETTGTS
jgi:hypothetical protein